MQLKHASHILPISESGTCLLENNPFYSSVRWHNVLSFIGGWRKRGESEYQTAVREWMEELWVGKLFFTWRKFHEVGREYSDIWDITYLSTLYTFQIGDEIARLLAMRNNIWSGTYKDLEAYQWDFIVDKERILRRVSSSLDILHIPL